MKILDSKFMKALSKWQTMVFSRAGMRETAEI